MPKINKNTQKTREQLGSQQFSLPKLDLLAVQKESYQWFVETGIKNLLEEISPIEDYSGKNWTLHFGNYLFVFKNTHIFLEYIRCSYSN